MTGRVTDNLSPGEWLARLLARVHQTANLPKAGPAGKKEGRMNPHTRSLAVEAIGDAWRGKITPRIRIAGQWLERAGFKPGHRVQVRLDQPGTLTLRFLDQSSYSGNGNGL